MKQIFFILLLLAGGMTAMADTWQDGRLVNCIDKDSDSATLEVLIPEREAWPTAIEHFIFEDMPAEYVVETTADETRSALRDRLAELTGLEDGMYNVERLTVKGTLNEWDADFIRSSMPYLKHVDLSGAELLCSTQRLFADKVRLVSVVLPEGLETIGEYAFYRCSALTSIVMPQCSAIEPYAFCGCRSLEEISIPATVFEIREYAFTGCSLKRLTLPSATIGMNVDAFLHSGLGHIELPGGKLTCTPSTLTLIPTAGELVGPQASLRFQVGNVVEGRCYGITQLGSPVELDGFTAARSEAAILMASIGGRDFNLDYVYYTPPSVAVDARISATASTLDIVPEVVKHPASIKTYPNVTTFRAPFPEDWITGSHWHEFPDHEDSLHFSGLDPATKYTYRYVVQTTTVEYSQDITVRTGGLYLVTQPAQPLAQRIARLCALTLISPEEENVGFEWRIDFWPDEKLSEIAPGTIDDGKLQAVITMLNPTFTYLNRAFYTSASGKTYYGAWSSFIIGDFDGINIPTERADSPQAEAETIVSLQGRRLQSLEKGVNIIRSTDGTARKVLKK